jgi:hypothetical protein
VCTPFQHRTKLLLVSHNFSNVMINNTSTDEAHYFQQIQDARAFAVAGGQPYGAAMIVNVAYTLVFNTGLFPDAFRA